MRSLNINLVTYEEIQSFLVRINSIEDIKQSNKSNIKSILCEIRSDVESKIELCVNLKNQDFITNLRGLENRLTYLINDISETDAASEKKQRLTDLSEKVEFLTIKENKTDKTSEAKQCCSFPETELSLLRGNNDINIRYLDGGIRDRLNINYSSNCTVLDIKKLICEQLKCSQEELSQIALILCGKPLDNNQQFQELNPQDKVDNLFCVKKPLRKSEKTPQD